MMCAKLYTRTGDKGSTSLIGGARVSKNSLRVEAYGTVDETNSWIGVARSFSNDTNLDQLLGFLQNCLLNCGAILSTPPDSKHEPASLKEDDIRYLEKGIDWFSGKTGPLKSFILPGGTNAASMLHVARTVCRRAERMAIALGETEPVDEKVVQLLNRASDLLFAAARYANFIEGREDIVWNSQPEKPDLD